jgi:RNA polymerase sigma factor (sigma-70 family)
MNTHYILIDGEKHTVSEEVYKAYQKFDNKIRYSEQRRNSQKVIVDSLNEKITVKDSPEVSLELLLESNKQIPDTRPCVEKFIEMKLMLEDAMSSLNADEREFIDLHYYHGFSTKELSVMMKTPVSTLYEKRSRILLKLHKLLSI